jgi:hypothetical protein
MREYHSGENSQVNSEKALHTIELLRRMTAERGATSGEEDTACRKIGQLIIRHNLSVLAPGTEQPHQNTHRHQQQQTHNRHQQRQHQWQQRTVCFEGVEAIGETEKALLCLIDWEEYWVPKSQISHESNVTERWDTGTLIVTRWWAEQRGLV